MTGFILVTELHRNYQYNFFYIFHDSSSENCYQLLPMTSNIWFVLITSGYAMDKSLVIIHALKGSAGRVRARVCACMCDMFSIYDNNIWPRLLTFDNNQNYYPIFHTNQTHWWFPLDRYSETSLVNSHGTQKCFHYTEVFTQEGWDMFMYTYMPAIHCTQIKMVPPLLF